MALSSLTFQDLDFRERLAECWTPLEGYSLRKVPYGMPRLSPDFGNCAVFLYGLHPKTGQLAGPIGTGAIVAMGSGPYSTRHVYAVTNWHVAVRDGGSIIRINTSDGKSRFIEFEPDAWQFVPGGDDIAAVDITERIDRERDEIRPITLRQFVTDPFIEFAGLGIGEDGLMLGMIANQPGESRNRVAARFETWLCLRIRIPAWSSRTATNGRRTFSICALELDFPDRQFFVFRTPDADLSTKPDGSVSPQTFPSYLFELPSTSITSPGNTLPPSLKRFNGMQSDRFVMLLGLHAGQYVEPIEVKEKLAKGEAVSALLDGNVLEVPSSLTIVVPAPAVEALLNMPRFRALRTEREANDEARRLSQPLIPKGEAATPKATEDNPLAIKRISRLY